MFKLVGASVVILASGLIGIKKYNEFYERKRNLQMIRDGAEKIKNNLRCMCMPLYECFLSGGEFFEEAAQYINEGYLPKDAVENAALSENCLKKDDKEAVLRFARGLSADDCNGQIANAQLFINELDKNISEADKELSTKGALFVKGSLLTAAAVVLILI